MIMDNLIGKRLKNLREASKMTQQELELEIGASFGHVSRIESGRINPTKEVLLKIAEVFELAPRDKQHFLGIGLGLVSQEEVEKARKEAHDYIYNSKYPIYLSDDCCFLHDWNETALKLFGVNPNYADKHRGINKLEILFNPDLEVRNIISEKRREKFVLDQLLYFLREIDYIFRQDEDWLLFLLNTLKEKNKKFSILWNKALKNYQNKMTVGENIFPIQIDGRNIELYMSQIRVGQSSRFLITEYLPYSSKKSL